jgi:acyl-CoA thioesterase FadM
VISCQPQTEGAASVIFNQQIWRERLDGEVLAEAKVKVVCVGADDFRPRRLPPEILGGTQ